MVAVLLVQGESRHVLRIFSWTRAQRGDGAPEVKSALISNNQGEVPLPRQSRATSHMFLAGCPALHHVLIIATTRDVTLKDSGLQRSGLRQKLQNFASELFFFFLKDRVCQILHRSSQRRVENCEGVEHTPDSCDPSVLVGFPNGLQNYLSPQFCRAEPSILVGPSAVINRSALLLPRQQTGFPVALSINAL